MRISVNHIVPGLVLAIAFTSPTGAETLESLLGLDNTMKMIGEFEGQKDPKCYATASRLEDFMYGTPLSDEARFEKIRLQKQFVRSMWQTASEAAAAEGAATVSEPHMRQVLGNFYQVEKPPEGDLVLKVPGQDPVQIKFTDYRQYSSIAYGLRAILGTQQDALLDGAEYVPLGDGAVTALKEALDVITLSALSRADRVARIMDQHSISGTNLQTEWSSMTAHAGEAAEISETADASTKPGEGLPEYTLLRKIIAEKTASYEAYNNISTAVFLRNIQVYFAKYRWPADPDVSNKLKILFNETMIDFANDLLLGSEAVARTQGHKLVRVEDVDQFVKTYIPFDINQYEDAVFFPGLPPRQRVEIEAYDMDAFRDSGLHWRYISAAIDEPGFAGRMEPDPFAAELIGENIAQLGVLLLRLAGDFARESTGTTLAAGHLQQALAEIGSRKEQHAALPAAPATRQQGIYSAAEPTTASSGTFFTDVTRQSGIDFRHHSADWLNRMIRSYTVRDKEVAVLAVPPAFGGSGAAVEDINNDGFPEVLLLGGKGNKLYLNVGKGRFKDITSAAGLDWTRKEDGFPGEPRQPIIADFDNDGLQDIFISYVNDEHRLYRNTGKGNFEDVSVRANLGGAGLVAGPATAMDFDNDGLLDIYIGYFGQYIEGIKPTLARRNFNGLPNKLFRNMGNMQFKDVTAGSGLANTGWTQAMSHTDLDRDGRQDLIVGNDFGINAYYHNKGDGTFGDIAPQLGVDKPSYTMNVGLTDLNRDLAPDIYISNIVTMDKDQKYVLPSEQTDMKFDAAKMARMRVVEANDLFVSRREGDKLFYEQSDAIGRGLSSTGWAWGADFFDFDNDGDEDLYVTNGMNEFAVYSSENPYYKDPKGEQRNVVLPESTRESNVFFVNEAGKLSNRSPESGADLLGNSRAVAYADLDMDGDQDMVLNNYHSEAVIYRNNSQENDNNWIKIKLIGDPASGSSRDAIGARIIVRGEDGWQAWREIHGSVGYLTMHPKEQHIGVGKAEAVDVTIEWPGNLVSRHSGLKPNVRYVIDQADHKSSGQEQQGAN